METTEEMKVEEMLRRLSVHFLSSVEADALDAKFSKPRGTRNAHVALGTANASVLAAMPLTCARGRAKPFLAVDAELQENRLRANELTAKLEALGEIISSNTGGGGRRAKGRAGGSGGGATGWLQTLSNCLPQQMTVVAGTAAGAARGTTVQPAGRYSVAAPSHPEI